MPSFYQCSPLAVEWVIIDPQGADVPNEYCSFTTLIYLFPVSFFFLYPLLYLSIVKLNLMAFFN